MPLLKTFISIHKSVKVRPTKYFFLLLFGIIALFAQAYMHNYNIVYIMMFFLVSVAGSSSYFGMKNLYPISLHFLSKERFFAGQNGSFSLKVENSADHSVYDIDIIYRDSHTYIKSLEAQSSSQIQLRTSFLKRGMAEIGIIHLESLFPLIHERKFRDINLAHELIVYPQPQGESLLSILTFKKDLSGDLSNFLGIENFRQGESLSSIHWVELAKTETLMKKLFSYETEQEELDFSYDRLLGDKEQKLSQLTLWVLECERYALEFRLRLKKKIYESRKETIDAILRELALF